jgi:hypothetical protein
MMDVHKPGPMSVSGGSEGLPDNLVLPAPGGPDGCRPLASPPLVIAAVTGTDHVQNAQLAGALIAFQDRKVASLFEHPPKQVSRLGRRHVFLEPGAEPHEVKEH